MRTYWDIPESERHALTEEQMDRFAEIEKAEAGVWIPEEPTPPDVPDVEGLDRVTVYRVKLESATERHSWWSSSADFRTREAAEAAARQMVHTRSENDVDAIHPTKFEIYERTVVTAASYAEHAGALEKVASLRETYKSARREYDALLEKAREATSGMWEDYAMRREEERELDEVRAAHKSHLELAEGDEVIARRFTDKAFSPAVARKALGDLVMEAQPAESMDPF